MTLGQTKAGRIKGGAFRHSPSAWEKGLSGSLLTQSTPLCMKPPQTHKGSECSRVEEGGSGRAACGSLEDGAQKAKKCDVPS